VDLEFIKETRYIGNFRISNLAILRTSEAKQKDILI